MRDKFWRKPDRWEADTSEYVFLANAVLQVGRARYPETWSDEDPGFYMPVRQSAAQRSFLARLLGTRSEVADPIISDEELELKKKKFLDSLVRFQGVMAEIVDQAERKGGLATFTRHKGGTGFSPMPRDWWQVSEYTTRFQLCQINVNEPGGYVAAGMGPNWAHIFVSREGLDALVAKIRGLPLAAEPASRKIEIHSQGPGKRRPRGYEVRDRQICAVIKEQLEEGSQPSCHAAALQLVDQIPGAGSDTSRVARIIKVFGKLYPP